MCTAHSAASRKPAANTASTKSTTAETTHVATTEPAAHVAATAEATTAAAAVTTAAASASTSSESVSPNRRHTESDHCKHDTNFAQHDFLHCERNALVSVLPDAPRKTRVMIGLERDVGRQRRWICAKLLLRSACCGDHGQRGWRARSINHRTGLSAKRDGRILQAQLLHRS
jgi:hypothetical protein